GVSWTQLRASRGQLATAQSLNAIPAISNPDHQDDYPLAARAVRCRDDGRYLLSCRIIGQVVGKRPEGLRHSFRMPAALNRLDQLVVERLVRQENRTFGFHARDRGFYVARGGKQQVLYHIDLVSEVDETQAGLQNANVGFAACEDDLFSLQAPEVTSDLLFLGQIEKVFLEKFRPLAQRLLDSRWQCALAADRTLQSHDHRYPEIVEQAGKVHRIRLDLGAMKMVG